MSGPEHNWSSTERRTGDHMVRIGAVALLVMAAGAGMFFALDEALTSTRVPAEIPTIKSDPRHSSIARPTPAAWSSRTRAQRS